MLQVYASNALFSSPEKRESVSQKMAENIRLIPHPAYSPERGSG